MSRVGDRGDLIPGADCLGTQAVVQIPNMGLSLSQGLHQYQCIVYQQATCSRVVEPIPDTSADAGRNGLVIVIEIC